MTTRACSFLWCLFIVASALDQKEIMRHGGSKMIRTQAMSVDSGGQTSAVSPPEKVTEPETEPEVTKPELTELETDLVTKTDCPNGWTAHGEHCYQRQGTKKTYDAASLVCKKFSAYLAVPNTEAENTFLATVMNQDKAAYTWLGFDYTKKKWEDGGGPDSTKDWRVLYEVDDAADKANGEPVVFIRPNKAWSFEAKAEEYPFICEQQVRGKVISHGVQRGNGGQVSAKQDECKQCVSLIVSNMAAQNDYKTDGCYNFNTGIEESFTKTDTIKTGGSHIWCEEEAGDEGRWKMGKKKTDGTLEAEYSFGVLGCCHPPKGRWNHAKVVPANVQVGLEAVQIGAMAFESVEMDCATTVQDSKALKCNVPEAVTAAVTDAVTDVKECKKRMVPKTGNGDPGYADDYRGWYDVRGCGECNDYCRWVGNTNPEGTDPATKQKIGTPVDKESWWSCRLSGTEETYTKKGTYDSWSFKKCAKESEAIPFTEMTAKQSSEDPNHGVGKAGKALTASPDAQWPGTCTHTKTDTEAWWKVTLASEYMVSYVKLTSRAACCPTRSIGWGIFVGTTECASNVDDSGDTTEETTRIIACNGKGSEITIKKSNSILSLCGFAAYGVKVPCALENESCACQGKVRYGFGSKWSSWKEVTGTVQCTNGVFGDSFPNQKKECQCEKAGTVSTLTVLGTKDTKSHPWTTGDGAYSETGMKNDKPVYKNSAGDTIKWEIKGEWGAENLGTKGVAKWTLVAGPPVNHHRYSNEEASATPPFLGWVARSQCASGEPAVKALPSGSNVAAPAGYVAKPGSEACTCKDPGTGLASCGVLCCAASPWTDPDPKGKYYYGKGSGKTVANLCYEKAA